MSKKLIAINIKCLQQHTTNNCVDTCTRLVVVQVAFSTLTKNHRNNIAVQLFVLI